MLYFFHGSDEDTARAKARALFTSLREKHPDALADQVTSEDFSAIDVGALTGEKTLLGKARIVWLDGVMDDKAMRETMREHAKTLAESPTIFIVSAGILEGQMRKDFAAVADREEECTRKGAQIMSGGKFTQENTALIFSVSDALGARDRKNLWVRYAYARLAGILPEEIHAILAWQVKGMALASEARSAGESGLSPFVFRKSRAFSGNFTANELHALSRSLLTIYHRARAGGPPLENALERFILTLSSK